MTDTFMGMFNPARYDKKWLDAKAKHPKTKQTHPRTQTRRPLVCFHWSAPRSVTSPPTGEMSRRVTESRGNVTHRHWSEPGDRINPLCGSHVSSIWMYSNTPGERCRFYCQLCICMVRTCVFIRSLFITNSPLSCWNIGMMCCGVKHARICGRNCHMQKASTVPAWVEIRIDATVNAVQVFYCTCCSVKQKSRSFWLGH